MWELSVNKFKRLRWIHSSTDQSFLAHIDIGITRSSDWTRLNWIGLD